VEGLISQTAVSGVKAAYNVLIGRGILDQVKTAQAYKNADRIAIVVSENVFALHKSKIEAAFDRDRHLYILLEDGEKKKTFSNVEPLLSKMLQGGLSRRSCVIAIGGGVIGDFVGFAASIYMRGVAVIQVPTTLLAMVDSSIGGKTAVNIGSGKNIAGIFHQPVLVVQDISFLETLCEKEFKNGLAECVKHAIIGDEELFELIERSSYEDLAHGEKLAVLVSRSSAFKVGVVSRDEFEKGERAILNFGHTVGHAIEAALHYGIAHGEAVAVGMYIIADICNRLGKLSDDEHLRITRLIDRLGLIEQKTFPATESILHEMTFDKKNESGQIRFVLIDGLYNPIYNMGVDTAVVRDAINSLTGRS
jgi:3-dehydroquinate synthase